MVLFRGREFWTLLFGLVMLSGWTGGSTSFGGDNLSSDKMVFLQFGDPEFRKGLQQHQMLEDAGYRLHNTGFDTTVFGERWKGSSRITTAQESDQPYYVDRITGGMPYQSLDGIGAVAAALKNDPRFLGFQAHEWGNSPTHDYHRVQKLIFERGKEFNAQNFAGFEGRTESPFFSGGDYSIYHDLYRELKTQQEVEDYLTRYFQKLVALTHGQLVSVTGHGQLHHAALRLGAKNVMAEIGNQVPLTAFQIACARGAARQHGKRFGAYYETWGGRPAGCTSATTFSPWWPNKEVVNKKTTGMNVGIEHGSGRSLQRRLLYYSWLSGAAWWSEEWGAENYFSNWDDYPLTDYGRVVQEFQHVTRDVSGLKPIVPIAIVTPPETFGIDIRFLAGYASNLWRIAPADDFHGQLRQFAKMFFAPQTGHGGRDAQNLTPSPWIGCFDVLDADASEETLARYKRVIYFDKQQAAARTSSVVFADSSELRDQITAVINAALPYDVEGQVGVAQAEANGRQLVGVFNNLGVKKTSEGEVFNPEAVQSAIVRGQTEGMRVLVGEAFVDDVQSDGMKLTIPAGELIVLSFPTEH